VAEVAQASACAHLREEYAVNAISAREAMLGDVRRALNREGKLASSNDRPGIHASSEPDDRVTEIKRRCQQRREDLIKQFESELTKVGGCFHRATTAQSAFQVVERIVSDRKAKTMVAFDTRLIDGIDLQKRVEESGVGFVIESNSDFIRTAAIADLGLSGVDYALAETGTLVLVARKGQARAISLLPPVHIAVLKTEQVISGLNDLFPLLRSETAGDGNLSNVSSAVTFITGPSRTADIELTLVVGVHGPQQLHVILFDVA
jgi:L-lactate dehydrogenase complex protein LldG